MAPLVRRSWSLRGLPPTQKQKAGQREKVSVAGALWLTPWRDRLGLSYQTIVNGYFNNEAVAGFLGDVLDELGGRAIVVWDGGTMHKGEPINALLEEHAGRIAWEPLPPYASEWMPVEQVWTWLKYGRLCNFAPQNACELNAAIFRELNTVRDNQERLQNFFHASKLSLPRALLL